MKKKKKEITSPYNTLHALSKKARLLRGAHDVLSWDQETYMPEGSIYPRAEKIELLSGMAHEIKTGVAFQKALSRLIDLKSGKILDPKLSLPKKAALKSWRHDFVREKALPTSFVEEFSRLASEAQNVWKKARAEDNFSLFLPYLEKIIELNQKRAELVGYEDHPYDALMEDYEPGATVKKLSPLFARVKSGLMPILKLKRKKEALPQIEYSENRQLDLSKELLKKIGFDFTFGRLDLSTHPFSTAFHPKDSRITTRLTPKNPFSNILTTLHEAGHALYEMGLPEEAYGSPLCEPVSLAIHESQSRLWETRIGLSLAFWKGFIPLIDKKLNPDMIYRAINQVTPSLIRVEADEVTYPAHVILRFEIEKGLIEKSIKAKEVPELWRAKMKESLGISPKNDREGCLQDVHWSMGAFGYFPTYLLGTLYASQFFEAFSSEHPDWQKRTEKLDLLFLREWLEKKIHRFGRQYSSEELLKKVTGHAPSEAFFLDYLTKKQNAL